MKDLETRRALMVQRQIAARGIRDQAVLDAMASVPREAFLAADLAEFAYDDTPLPIPHQQTISQPYVVAFMIEALGLKGGERVLEIGTGSGYAAAVLACIAREVYTVERHRDLADTAASRLARLGYTNVRVLHGDGTLGWPDYAPYDAVVVTAGAPAVPRALVDQLALGGRLVIPVGRHPVEQTLLRVTRLESGGVREEDLGGVRFVPLVGAQGWPGDDEQGRGPPRPGGEGRAPGLLVAECAEPFGSIEDADLDPFLDRVGDARLVLLGESTHGTSEFYRLRARLTRALVERKGFRFVAVEADWPDAARVHRFLQPEQPPGGPGWEAFARFPGWTWRNRESLELIAWLRGHNLEQRDARRRVGFHGLDLYSLNTSIRQVLDYLDAVDPRAARTARERYGCLSPWERDPTTYGHAALHGLYRSCEHEAVAMLQDMLQRRLEYAERDGERFLDALHNARLVADAERYYRALYYGGNESWNLRDRHMFGTLQALLEHYGDGACGVVWAHNTHVGDARATEPGALGQLDLGQLCREAHGERARLVGLTTDRGTLLAARAWDGQAEVRRLRPAHPESHEGLLRSSGVPRKSISTSIKTSPSCR